MNDFLLMFFGFPLILALIALFCWGLIALTTWCWPLAAVLVWAGLCWGSVNAPPMEGGGRCKGHL